MGGRNKTKGARAKPPSIKPHWAIVTYIHNDRQSGFYLDSVVPGTEADAKVEVEAATRSEGLFAEGLRSTFYAPVTSGLRALSEKPRAGQPKAPLNVWLLRRSVGNQREYEAKFVKALSRAEPEHSEDWQCILLESGWTRPG